MLHDAACTSLSPVQPGWLAGVLIARDASRRRQPHDRGLRNFLNHAWRMLIMGACAAETASGARACRARQSSWSAAATSRAAHLVPQHEAVSGYQPRILDRIINIVRCVETIREAGKLAKILLHNRQSSRLEEKTFTRNHPCTLRLHLSCISRRSLTLSNGATDASGR